MSVRDNEKHNTWNLAKISFIFSCAQLLPIIFCHVCSESPQNAPFLYGTNVKISSTGKGHADKSTRLAGKLIGFSEKNCQKYEWLHPVLPGFSHTQKLVLIKNCF